MFGWDLPAGCSLADIDEAMDRPTLTLSQAIRRGSEMSEEIRGKTLAWGDEPVAGCALGAAYLAICGVPGWNPETKQKEFVQILPALRSLYPELAESSPIPPAVDIRDDDSLEQIIMHLMDTCRWTRIAIADWLASIGL